MKPELKAFYLLVLTKKETVHIDDDGSQSVSDGNYAYGIDDKGWYSFDLWAS